MKTASVLALCLVIIGALVWLTVGIFNFNFVAFLFGAGGGAVVSRIIYSLVGVSAIASMFILPNCATHKDEYCKCDI